MISNLVLEENIGRVDIVALVVNDRPYLKTSEEMSKNFSFGIVRHEKMLRALWSPVQHYRGMSVWSKKFER